MTSAPGGPMLTRTQVAAELGVSVKTLYTWEKRGLVPPPERDRRGWRRYGPDQVERIRAVQRAIHPNRQPPDGSNEGDALRLSARNRLRGTVTAIVGDGVLAEVTLNLGGGNEVVAVITRSSVERLGLRVGAPACAVIKATEVLLAR